MKIIDAHAHIYERLTGFGPRGEARAVGGGMVEWATGERERFLRPEHGDKGFFAEKLVELMDEGGVERAVILQGPNYGLQNSYIAESVARYPDRLTGAGSFDVYCAKADEIFANLTEKLGFGTIKFEISREYGFSGYHPHLDINDGVFDRYFSMCEEKGITVTLDTGVWGTSSYQIEGIIDMLSRHKDLTLVIAHSLFPSGSDGNNGARLEYIKRLARENVYFDIANLNSSTDPHRREYFRAVADIVGADHMMWGTDCPGALVKHTYREIAEYVTKSGYFTDAELCSLMHDTAVKAYGIEV